MRVGLNLIFLAPGAGGTGTYVSELVASLLELPDAPELVLFAGPDAPPEFRAQPWAGDVRWVDYPKGPDSRWNLLEIMLAIPARAARDRIDVVHSPANVGPLLSPGTARVVTLRDLIWHHHPEGTGDTRVGRARVQILSVRSAKAAQRVIAFSEAAADDIVATLGLPRERIDVTPLGTRAPATARTPESELRRRLELGDSGFVLSVAQKKPYKNLEVLIRALPDLPPGTKLVLAGAPDADHEGTLWALAERCGVADRVRIPDWLPAEDVEALYAAASCVALPSFTEGFGLPVIEAMQRGAPVACSGRSALAEVAGDAALLFDPYDQRSISDALARLVGDEELRRRLAAAGRERAASFTWERTAQATIASYERAAAR